MKWTTTCRYDVNKSIYTVHHICTSLLMLRESASIKNSVSEHNSGVSVQTNQNVSDWLLHSFAQQFGYNVQSPKNNVLKTSCYFLNLLSWIVGVILFQRCHQCLFISDTAYTLFVRLRSTVLFFCSNENCHGFSRADIKNIYFNKLF